MSKVNIQIEELENGYLVRAQDADLSINFAVPDTGSLLSALASALFDREAANDNDGEEIPMEQETTGVSWDGDPASGD